MVEIHAYAKRVGNSWGVIIPKETADELKLNEKVALHIEIGIIPELKELKGTFKTKKTMGQLMKEIDKGWD